MQRPGNYCTTSLLDLKYKYMYMAITNTGIVMLFLALIHKFY